VISGGAEACHDAGVSIVDVWAQQPNDQFLSDPMFDSLRRWRPGSTDPAFAQDGALIAHMDTAGVDKAIVAAWWGPAGPIISNDSVGHLCRTHPDRLVGAVSVDLSRPMAAVNEIRRCVTEYDVRAVRVLPWPWGLPPDDRRYYPVYVACCDLDLTFCTQVGHAGPLRESEPGRPIPYLDRVALEFPELRIVGGHIGVPWLAETISLATKYPNFYIDTSAYVARRYPGQLVDYLQTHGRHKVMFGSNHPFWPAADCLDGLDNLDLSDAVRTAFLSGNAHAAFRLR
jgi:predicted TIM-barrel fold metal-dependent hydrolase